MKDYNNLKLRASTVAWPLLFCLLIWIVYWVEIRFHLNFSFLGIRPLKFSGLRGVIFSPFLHSSLKHLWHNTLPLLTLSIALFYFYRPISWRILCLGIILTGLLTWLIGRPSIHIGASGVIYFLCSFLFFKGIWSKHYRLLALSLGVIFIYGSLVWGTLPDAVGENVSWEGHLAGLLSGIVIAMLYRKSEVLIKEKFKWEEPSYKEDDDIFMQHFDENGNFIPNALALDEEEENEEIETSEFNK